VTGSHRNRRHIPTVDDVLLLPSSLEFIVTPDLMDENEHMNVQHYLAKNAQALGVRLKRVGISSDLIPSQRRSGFTTEHHLYYLSEVVEGNPVSCHVRLTGRTSKALWSTVFMVERSSRKLALVMETVVVYVNMDSRRASDFLPAVAAELDAEITADQALPWPMPVMRTAH
jgi:acyl-CoA thioester hydrolase